LSLACGDNIVPPPDDGTLPVVDLSLSSTNMTAPGDIALVATASDDDGVQRVEFYEQIDGVDVSPTKLGEDAIAPYELQRPILSAAENGSYAFNAKAYDAAGNVGTSAAQTAVVNLASSVPAFALSASHNRITSPGRITFSVEALEGLSRLEIYERGKKVSESAVSQTPLSATVDVTSAENGRRVYVGRGHDAGGEIGFSNTLPILIDIGWDLIRELEGMATDNRLHIASDASDATYVATTVRTESNAVIDLNVILSKYDVDGNRSWTRSFGNNDWESLYSVGVDQSGRVYLSGHTSYRGEGQGQNPDCFLAVFDALGRLLWTRLIDTPLLDALCVATTGSSGAFYVAGVVEEGRPGAGRTDLFVAKYNQVGTQLWIREFGSLPGAFGDDVPTSIAVDPLEGVYVAGYTSGGMEGTTNQGGRDVFVAKLDGDGNRLWARQFGTSDHDFANALAADPEGGVYVAGGRDHPDFRFGRFGDALLARYSSDGTLMWQRTLDGGDFDDAWDIIADRNLIQVVGRTSRGTSGELTERTQGPSDAFLAKLSRDGDLLSVRLLGGPGHDGATGVALGRDGDVYVGLSSSGGLPGVPNPGSRVLARHREATP
jgi:hypothetical protein